MAPASLSGFYFFNFGALGGFFPFLPLLLAERGLTAEEISWVMVIIPAANLVIPPLWGLIADALRARLALLRIAAIGAAGAMLLFAPAWKLAGSLLAATALSLFRAPLTSLADATAGGVLARSGGDFGRIRVWGSVGFGLFVFAIGQANPSRHPLVMVVAAAVAYLLSAAATLPLKTPPSPKAGNVLSSVGAILVEPPILALLAANAFHYVAHGAYDALFSLHLRGIGFGDGFVGSAWMVGIVAEVLVLLLARRVIARAGGAGLLAACSAVAALRWWLLSVLISGAAILCAQVLHGITFGLWYVALVHTIQKRAPDHLRTSLQSIAFACMGLGTVAGYLVGGVLLAKLGGARLFQMCAACAATASLLYLVSHQRRARSAAA